MYQDLCIPFDPLIKLLIRRWSIVDTDLMAHHKAGIGFARDDHIAKIAIVFLDVALACSEAEPLLTSEGSVFLLFQPVSAEKKRQEQ